MDECIHYGDEVEVIKEVRSYDGKVLAFVGAIGIAKSSQVSTSSVISVLLEGRRNNLDIPCWSLHLRTKNEKQRQLSKEYKDRSTELLKVLNPQVGSIINIREILSTRTFKVCVTRLLETGIYGYRINSKGERMKGRLGLETYFSASSLENARNAVTKYKYAIGEVCLTCIMGRNIYSRVGVVLKCTTRTVHIQWEKGKAPRIYPLKGFQYVPESREKIQQKLDGAYDTPKHIFNNATIDAAERLHDLGFDISKLTIIEETHI